MTLPEILEWLAARDGSVKFTRSPDGSTRVVLTACQGPLGLEDCAVKDLPPTAGGYLLMVTVADLYKEVRAAAGEGKP